MSIEKRLAYRQHYAVPALDAFKAWLDALRPTILGNSGTANAMDYTLRRWPALVRYVDDGSYPERQQPDRKCHPTHRIGPQELAICGL